MIAPGKMRAFPASGRPPGTSVGGPGPRILMTTEGTYPYGVGGVSSWCDLLVKGLPEFRWQVLPIVAGGRLRSPVFELPAHAALAPRIDLWSEELPGWRWRRRADPAVHTGLPGVLVRELLSWRGELRPLVEALVWCRLQPDGVRRAFRSQRGWDNFLDRLQEVLDEPVDEAGPAPALDVPETARLYQTLYWVARAAAAPTPVTDLLLVTAAGWAVVPALVHQALHGSPLLLTEHGVYVREAYLAAARSDLGPGARFVATRLAWGLTRASYAAADVVAPVAEANALWERRLGVDPWKVRTIYNGVEVLGRPVPAPRRSRVVSLGRIDPLKDIHTMLRVADEVVRRVPEAQFLYYGPVTEGQEVYGRSCHALHARLGLGDRFRFMGRTADPARAVQEADVILMTSISEGLPMSILEAMTHARPVVATGVGGVPEVVRGCGVLTSPGDVHGLTMAVSALLRDPALASRLGLRAYARVARTFTQKACLGAYRQLFGELTTGAAPS